MKSYGVTTQMKPLQQYFHIVLFVKNLELFGWTLTDFDHLWAENERVNEKGYKSPIPSSYLKTVGSLALRLR